MPLLARVKGENLALPPVLFRHVRQHAQQLPVIGLGNKSRIIQGMGQFPQARHPETVVPGKKRLGRRLVDGLPRTNVHRTNVTAREKSAIALPFRQEARYRLRRLAKPSHSGSCGCSSRVRRRIRKSPKIKRVRPRLNGLLSHTGSQGVSETCKR